MDVSPSRKWLKPGLLMGSATLVLGAGAAAAMEADTVGSYWRGLWWAISLMTTVGFVGPPPKTVGGAVISAVLMLTGFMLLSLVSASLASLFVREDEKPSQQRDEAVDQQILGTLNSVLERLESLESRALDNDSLRRATDRPDAV